jgi:hypothetical protein
LQLAERGTSLIVVERVSGLHLADDQGLTIFAYTAEPGSKSEQALNLLAKLGGDA